jgi:hypothetical protein
MGWHPLIKGFTAFWLTGVTLFTLGAAIAVAFLVATGQGIAGDLPIVLVPAAMLGFGSTLVGLAGRAGWRDADFLRGWLAERLQASGPR